MEAKKKQICSMIRRHGCIGYENKIVLLNKQKYGIEIIQNIEKQVLLQTIDKSWREHLLKLEHLRSVIGFRGYAQRDPLNEYKSEAYELFEVLLQTIGEEVTKFISFFQYSSDRSV